MANSPGFTNEKKMDHQGVIIEVARLPAQNERNRMFTLTPCSFTQKLMSFSKNIAQAKVEPPSMLHTRSLGYIMILESMI